MGNRSSGNLEYSDCGNKMSNQFKSVDDFEFHGLFDEEDTNNGLFFNDTFIPDEILIQILSFVPPKQLLSLSLVCKKWCNIIKSEILWMEIYSKEHLQKAKLLPWYVYYLYYTTDNFKNLLKNGNGQNKYAHWTIKKNLGDQFRIENPPCGSDPLPEGVPDFYGCKSCFATSFYECNKIQEIQLEPKKLLRYVMNKFTPHIYVSEWVTPRFDCGSRYKLRFRGFGATSKLCKEYFMKEQDSYMDLDDDEEEPTHLNILFDHHEERNFEQWSNKPWEKVEIVIQEYPKNVMTMVFEHEGCDEQFWKGHYGSKMAGGIVKMLFDTIEPVEEIN